MWYGSDLSLANNWYQANGYFNLVLANNRTAHQLDAMDYDTLYEFGYDSTSSVGHCDQRVVFGPVIVNAIEWAWSDRTETEESQKHTGIFIGAFLAAILGLASFYLILKLTGPKDHQPLPHHEVHHDQKTNQETVTTME